MPRPKPCSICRHWFRPDPRLGEKQSVCSAEECQQERQRRNVAAWVRRHPDDAIRRRIERRQQVAATGEAVDPLTVRPPLDQLPWDLAQAAFAVDGADFLAHLARLMRQPEKKSMADQVGEITPESEKVGAYPAKKSMTG
jgi:hypothetical protein